MSKVTTLDYFEYQAKSGIWGSLYNPRNSSSYPFIVRFNKSIDLIESIKNKTVLDLGCGTGVLIPYVNKNGGKYIGIDISQNMIDEVKKEYSELIESKEVSIHHTDIANFIVPDNVDIIIGLGFIEYFNNPQSIIDKLYEQLPKGGQLIFSFPNFNSLDYFSLMLFAPIRYIIRTLSGKSTSQPPRTLWNKNMAKKLFENSGFKEQELSAYNINIFAYPFTKISMRFVNFFSRIFEYSSLSKVVFFATGFIISGKK